MDAQEIFDTVATHLFKQNQKSKDSYGDCVYRGKNKNKCAIGCLIKDDEYKRDMEGQTISQLLRSEVCPPSLFNRLSFHKDLLICLQEVHDTLDVFDWEIGLENIADEFGLKFDR